MDYTYDGIIYTLESSGNVAYVVAVNGYCVNPELGKVRGSELIPPNPEVIVKAWLDQLT